MSVDDDEVFWPETEEDTWVDDEEFDRGWSPAMARIDDISRLLWRREKVLAEISEYDRLEQVEVDRIKRAREAAIGPAVRRLAWIDRQVDAFAVRAWLDEGKTRWATPNGIISSTVVGTRVEVDDDQFTTWEAPESLTPIPAAVSEMRSKVFVKPLRKWLDAEVKAGMLQRLVLAGEIRNPDYSELVDEGFAREFVDDEVGYWMVVETGEVVPGVTWAPGGDDGSGRNFRIASVPTR